MLLNLANDLVVTDLELRFQGVAHLDPINAIDGEHLDDRADGDRCAGVIPKRLPFDADLGLSPVLLTPAAPGVGQREALLTATRFMVCRHHDIHPVVVAAVRIEVLQHLVETGGYLVQIGRK